MRSRLTGVLKSNTEGVLRELCHILLDPYGNPPMYLGTLLVWRCFHWRDRAAPGIAVSCSFLGRRGADFTVSMKSKGAIIFSLVTAVIEI